MKRDAAKKSLNVEDQAQMLILMGGFQGSAGGIANDFASAYKGNADGSVKTALDDPSRATAAALSRFSEFLKTFILDNKGIAVDVAALDQLRDSALGAVEDLSRRASVQLDRLLNDCHRDLQEGRRCLNQLVMMDGTVAIFSKLL